jgi:hypothetical protein
LCYLRDLDFEVPDHLKAKAEEAKILCILHKACYFGASCYLRVLDLKVPDQLNAKPEVCAKVQHTSLLAVQALCMFSRLCICRASASCPGMHTQ